ncbi:50S ribosomal protein L22 [Candidatus Gracilibacteria bacterium]|nr:50S ribosomal protein L22 [Candidatus Gracilibacteria bacterium]
MKAHLRRVRISPKKTNLVAGLVRGKDAVEALSFLKFAPQKAGAVLYKVLHSAVANAENIGGKIRENLKIKSIVVNKGPFYKRSQPSTRGRALPISKPTAHISVELEEK